MESDTKKINQILVPVDFSNYSLNASYFAIHLAARTGASIKVFHSFFNPMLDAMTFPDTFTYQSNLAEVFQELEESAKKSMERFLDIICRYMKMNNFINIKITSEVVPGQPGEEIQNAIKSQLPDIVIIGTRGKGEKESDILGSVAGKIIDKTDVPVLLVTQDARLNQFDSIKVLYATNFDTSDYKAVDTLVKVLDGFSITIEFVHFDTDNSSGEEMNKILELVRNFSRKYEDIAMECHIIKSDDIMDSLNLFISEKSIDLIALTHKKRNLFYRLFNPGLAKKLLFVTGKPVFVFN